MPAPPGAQGTIDKREPAGDAGSAGELFIRLVPQQVLKLLLGIIAVLTALGVATDISRGIFGHSELYGLVRLFNTSQEANVPTFYSSVSLLGSAVILFFISRIAAAEQKRGWQMLAVLFLLLSLDESAQFHELGIRPAREFLSADGILFFGWVIFALPIIAILGFVFIPFMLRLPKSTRRLMTIAAFMLVFGAVGMEMIGAPYAERYGEYYLPYRLITDIEELVEMLAVALWNYALLCHLNGLLAEANKPGVIITTRPAT